MTETRYQREIAASPAVVFDLCRSIDFHLQAAQAIRARAVGGQTTGLAQDGTATIYSAAFFGCRFRLTMVVSHYHAPHQFRDTMTRGFFSHFSHQYTLTPTPQGCLLQDTFSFASPVPSSLAILGRGLERFLLGPSLAAAQNTRLDAIKEEAERTNS